MKIAVGSDDFSKIIREEAVFVDKTLLIKEIIEDGSEVLLITRPRRWGKTLNMSMLQCFFAEEVSGNKTKGLFDRFAIATCDDGKYIREHQGKYPVIFISFKDVQEDSFEKCFQKITALIKRVYDQFSGVLLESTKLSFLSKKNFRTILEQDEVSQTSIEDSLLTLSLCLNQHYKERVYILIDEYDKPLNVAYGEDYFDKLNGFLRNLLSAGLKSNPALKKGIMTGILRISKGTMLSGLNNLNEFSVLDKKYAEYFGFTDNEVSALLKQRELMPEIVKIKTWYNGYKVGEVVIYNPWSIMKCLEQKGDLKPYWIDTTDDTLIQRTLIKASPEIKDQLVVLMQNKSIKVKINKNITYENLEESRTNLWSLLLFTGYLRAELVTYDDKDNLYNCEVSIPNQEIRSLYSNFTIAWFRKLGNVANYATFIDKLLEGDVEYFTKQLENYLLSCVSIYDIAAKPEAFYHGFVLALLASLQDNYYISSNRESGLGRYDVMIVPKLKSKSGALGIILEFKRTEKHENLKEAAKKALEQIEKKIYESEFLKYDHVTHVLKVGMAFSGKAVLSAYVKKDMKEKKEVEVKFNEEKYVDDDVPLAVLFEASKRKKVEVKQPNEPEEQDTKKNKLVGYNATLFQSHSDISQQKLVELIQRCDKKISQQDGLPIVSIIFSNQHLARQLQQSLKEMGIEDIGMPGQALKVNVITPPSSSSNANETYAISLSEAEFESIMGEGSFAKLISSQQSEKDALIKRRYGPTGE